ncbi:MAG TPA: ROK family protein, partial [Actinomycetota bacterium]|nr:ROK family protein [Actinomycetota bacterium]
MNERTVLEFIRQRGPVSRAQIARDSGLSKPTVSQALAALERTGLVREAGRSTGGKGPSALLYELDATAGWVVGIDVGRAWLRAAIANLTGDIVARRDERAKARSARSLIEQIGRVAHGLAGEAGLRWRQVTFAVVGSPGVVRPARDQVVLAHNLPGWGRHGLIEAVQEELGTKTAFENDVNLATVGEHWKGLGKGVDNFVYLHVGTGVGLGLVVNGELYRGATGIAGEIAYLPLVADPHHPASRRHGALESVLGAKGLLTFARSRGLRSPLSLRTVFSAARRGDQDAAAVVEVAIRYIALAIATVVPVMD